MHTNTVREKVYRNAGNTQVLRWVPDGTGRVLDVGCGAGDNARTIAGRAQAVDGITLSQQEAAVAQEFCAQVWVHNLEDGLPAETARGYDVVIASHVLEHLCRPEKLLQDIAQRLKPDGRLIVALPNLLFWRNRWHLFCGRFEYADAGIMDNTHYKWYTFTSAQRLLEANGFSIEKAYADGSFPLPLVRRWLPAGVKRAVDRVFSQCWPGLFGYQMLFIASRRSR